MSYSHSSQHRGRSYSRSSRSHSHRESSPSQSPSPLSGTPKIVTEDIFDRIDDLNISRIIIGGRTMYCGGPDDTEKVVKLVKAYGSAASEFIEWASAAAEAVSRGLLAQQAEFYTSHLDNPPEQESAADLIRGAQRGVERLSQQKAAEISENELLRYQQRATSPVFEKSPPLGPSEQSPPPSPSPSPLLLQPLEAEPELLAEPFVEEPEIVSLMPEKSPWTEHIRSIPKKFNARLHVESAAATIARYGGAELFRGAMHILQKERHEILRELDGGLVALATLLVEMYSEGRVIMPKPFNVDPIGPSNIDELAAAGEDLQLHMERATTAHDPAQQPSTIFAQWLQQIAHAIAELEENLLAGIELQSTRLANRSDMLRQGISSKADLVGITAIGYQLASRRYATETDRASVFYTLREVEQGRMNVEDALKRLISLRAARRFPIDPRIGTAQWRLAPAKKYDYSRKKLPKSFRHHPQVI